MKLSERVAVVTGGANGIGAEICRVFAKEGARVAVADVNADAASVVASEIVNTAGRAAPFAFDVTSAEAVDQGADAVERELGPIEIWVNNAGISKIVPFLQCSEEQWNTTLKVNLTGTFLGCQAAIRRMLPRKRGIVINMSSQSGKVGASHYQAYCASKFGVLGLTQSLAAEFAREGIRVNALCPGIVLTGMWEQQMNDYACKKGLRVEELIPYWQATIPAGRVASVTDVAEVALFLASDASAYVVGQAINVSGGAIME